MAMPVSPCGIKCDACDAYISTQTQDLEMKQKLADNYKEHFKVDIPLDQLDCDGCTSDGRHIGFCAQCTIRSCSRAKGYATCAECADFPCEKGSFIWTRNSVSKANLEALK